MRQAFAPSDYFHWVADQSIRRAGGPGNLGQLRVRLREPLADPTVLCSAWTKFCQGAPPLGASIGWSWRGPHFRIGETLDSQVEIGSDAEALATAHMRRPGRGLARLGLADTTVVLTWNHQLFDARGAMALLASLDKGEGFGEAWSEPAYRAAGDLPERAAERGRLARGAVELLRDHRAARLLRPTDRNQAAPLDIYHLSLGLEKTSVCDQRQRLASGRFGETPYLLAALGAALEEIFGVGGDLLFPLAVDERKTPASALLANRHGFMMLRIPAGMASRDLGEAARHLQQEHRAWIAADGSRKLAAALSWFPYIGYRLSHAQLGFNRAGIAASCLVANTGKTLVPERWFGAEVLGVDHAAVIPAVPGVGVLFHRDRRGLGFDVMVSGRLAERMPAARLADALTRQLLERPVKAE